MNMKKKPPRIRHLIGIDEVGRGPIAGPVTLCAFLISKKDHRALRTHFRGVKDSKQLTLEQREEWHARICVQRSRGFAEYALASIGPRQIDSRGLSWAINSAVRRCLAGLRKKLAESAHFSPLKPSECLVLLDGSLKAPPEFIHQRTIIKGDEKEPIIALASIVAKVTRDRRLTRLAKIYPAYGFEVHKGYGTRSHYLKISAHGMCPLHRRSFLKNFSLK